MQIGVVTEAFLDRSLLDVMEFLERSAPEVTALELGSGGYASHPHCDRELLLGDERERRRWAQAIAERGFTVAALNAWGNPLHPDPDIARAHDRDLRDTIRLAAQLGVRRVVALAGEPAAAPGDRVPHFAGGGWLPYLEGVYERQWADEVAPYWSSISEFARAEHAELMICIELHPGTAVYNVETFTRFAALGSNLAANIDPSHFFWQQMDTRSVIEGLGAPIGHAHAKDVAFNPAALARNGLLDHRWPGPTEEMPWSFATVGRGHDEAWWRDFLDWLAPTQVRAAAIEHEDPDVPAETGIIQAAQLLHRAAQRSFASP